jgi:2-polyprenyl-6-methoxyphenol hydroxylase-like FAD-dependent oxidoreductase
MNNKYDVIIVGARCAGSPTAKLLARKGYRVLLLDRATFPSDTLSTHVVQPAGVATLAKWGLLDRLVATGCPPIDTYTFDFGPFAIAGSPGTAESPVAYCPRRIVLDKLLVDAAAEAGAEVRQGFTVAEILTENGCVVGIKGHSKSGQAVEERASCVVGADGWHSVVARAVRPEQYNEKPALQACYYTYWSNLPVNGRFEIYIRPNRGFAAVPTHDGLTLVVGGWPFAEFEENKHDVEGTFAKAFELVPAFAARVKHAKREARFAGACLPNYFRKPYGPGWALVGDAGYLKDAITAQGIHNAFRDAERCVSALDQALTGARPFDEAMGEYQRERDEQALPMYEYTCQLAALAPPPPEMQQLLGAIHGKQAAMDGFVRVYAGSESPARYFSPENVEAMLAPAPM